MDYGYKKTGCGVLFEVAEKRIKGYMRYTAYVSGSVVSCNQ